HRRSPSLDTGLPRERRDGHGLRDGLGKTRRSRRLDPGNDCVDPVRRGGLVGPPAPLTLGTADVLIAQNSFFESRRIVTAPSFTSSTCMCAWKTPSFTSSP